MLVIENRVITTSGAGRGERALAYPRGADERNEEKSQRERYFKHTFGVLLGLHPPLCSHAVASAGQPSSECVSHSIRGWEAARFSALVSDILHLPREAGQPCHSNVKHMWNRPGAEQTNTHTHTHKTEDGTGGSQNNTDLYVSEQTPGETTASLRQDNDLITRSHVYTKFSISLKSL